MLSTIKINRNGRGLLRDAQAVHRTLLHATGGARPLWGCPSPHGLVVRHDAPVDWKTAMAGVADGYTTRVEEIPAPGAEITFGLIGNPAKAEKREGTRGKITALPEAEWDTWLLRKLAPALDIPHLTLGHVPLANAHGVKPQRRVTLRRVMFRGEAIVNDQIVLAQLLANGVGRGKAYGCGLLLVEENG
ncbi:MULTISPECIES: type I-E CRISPR-associated protein Cas6/Cse3/CasE [Corynebacterium]|uniref:type I-E CRISPR-associated protein Cas6/Cse3/CasE n=1 Tax=Corynebacterium TaxID=1716 RepID=UPI00124E4CBE|nr:MULTISPECIES: type I-E CRISPR-associated protein Cas6/Cse3/CasE [Corynebacterium]